MIKKAVLLCGGLATRMLPITKSIPKEMLPLLTRPAIDYCLQDLKDNGITDVLIVIGRNKESLENYFDRNIELEDRLLITQKEKELNLINSIYKDMNIYFVRQIEAKGTGYATNLARNFVGNCSFILLYPDDLIIGDSFSKQLINEYKKTKTNIIPIKKININDCHKYGMVGVEKNIDKIKITKFIEKPSIENTPSNICYTGSGIFTSEIFNYLPYLPLHSNGEQLLTDIFQHLIKKDHLYGVYINGTRLDIGSPIGYLKGNILMGLQNPEIKDDLLNFIKELNL